MYYLGLILGLIIRTYKSIYVSFGGCKDNVIFQVFFFIYLFFLIELSHQLYLNEMSSLLRAHLDISSFHANKTISDKYFFYITGYVSL